MSHPPPADPSNSHDQSNTPQQTPSSSNVTPNPPAKTRTPRPGSVKMPTPPTYKRTPSTSGHDKDSFHGYGPSSRLTPGSEGRLSPSTPGGLMSPSISNSSAFVFPLRSVFQNQNKSQSSQGNEGKPPGMQTSTSGRQLASSNDNSDLLVGDAGIDSIQQLLEKTTEPRERKQPSGNPGVATFSGKLNRSGSTASQVGGVEDIKPQKPASAGILPGGGGEPSGGFFSMPPNMAGKEHSQSPFFEDALSRRQSISNGQIGRNTSTKKTERPKPETRTSGGSGSTAKIDNGLETPRPQPTNSSTTAEGSGLPDSDRAPVGQPQGPVNEINFRHRPGGDSVDAATSFSSQKRHGGSSSSSTHKRTEDLAASTTQKDTDDPKSTSTTRPADRVFQQKRQASQTGIKEPRPQSVGKGAMPGLGASEGVDKQTGRSSHLEMDDKGEQQLIQDFTGIVRLGDPESSNARYRPTGTASGGDTGSRGRTSLTGSGGSVPPRNHREARHNNNRDHTQSSVQNFVNDQSHTENMADPNAPTPMQAASTAKEQASEMVIPDTPPSRPPSNNAQHRSNVQSDGNRSSNQTGSSTASAQANDSSEAASASELEDEDEYEDEEDEDIETSEDEEPIVTFRFEHTQNTDGHHVVVGREGILRRCEDEPITTPGAVQGFGVLMVLEEEYETGDLVVRQVSEVSVSYFTSPHRSSIFRYPPCPPLCPLETATAYEGTSRICHLWDIGTGTRSN